MDIFLYTGITCKNGKQLQQQLASSLPKENMYLFQNIEEFASPYHHHAAKLKEMSANFTLKAQPRMLDSSNETVQPLLQ